MQLQSETSIFVYPSSKDRIVRQAHTVFIYVILFGVVATLVWASITELDKITRGSGRIVPQTQLQTVQHLEGGIVSEILVKEGDLVEAGQPLMRVENSGFSAELAQSRIEAKAKEAMLIRLEAEIAQQAEIEWPAGLKQEIGDIVAGEVSVFQRRSAKLKEELLILDEQIKQKQVALSELRTRKPTVERERAISEERYGSLKHLADIGAVSNNELLESERALQQSIGRASELAHTIPRTEAELNEIVLRKSEATKVFQSDAEKDRQLTLVQLSKLKEAITALEERSNRSDVSAPVKGRINKLYVATVGGVAKAGAPLAEIVPEDAKIEVEMRLMPADRAEVWIGQPAAVKISAYDYEANGSLPGKVIDISPDALLDEKGQYYFRVRLEADGGALGPGRPVLPGMISDVRLLSGRHTILSYILRPLRAVSENALR